MPWRSYLVLFAVSAVCLAINPGFRTEITERGLDYSEFCYLMLSAMD